MSMRMEIPKPMSKDKITLMTRENGGNRGGKMHAAAPIDIGNSMSLEADVPDTSDDPEQMARFSLWLFETNGTGRKAGDRRPGPPRALPRQAAKF